LKPLAVNSHSLEHIISECQKNKRKAQNELFTKYKDTLYFLSLKYCRNEADAEDNLQESFMTIFEKIKTYKGKGSFEGWMKRITIYKAIDRYKKQKEFPTEEFPSLEDTSIEKELTKIPLGTLLGFVQELPDQYRLVFNLFQLDGYSHREVSQMLSISESTSKSNYHRAKLILKQKITDYHLEVQKNKPSYGS